MMTILMNILAFFFAVAVLAKLGLLLLQPRLWLDVVRPLVADPVRLMRLYAGIAAVSGLVVLIRLSIIDVAAVMVFASSLIGLALAPYGSSLLKLTEEISQEGLEKAWAPFAVWIILALWVLYSLFS
ncbi:MAG: hypothetical protein FJ128_09470 [Deltaproteobacteria bacterium]|nr:hypothetical protein [Deltaproteobacteria bacterium]